MMGAEKCWTAAGKTLAAVLLIGVLMLIAGGDPVRAQQDEPVLTDDGVEYTFGGEIEFRARITVETGVEEVLVFVKSPGDPSTSIGQAEIRRDRAVYRHDVKSRFVQPFATIEYWFQAKMADGELFTTRRFSFEYTDDRFDWSELEEEGIRVYAYAHDGELMRFFLDTAQQVVQQSAAILNASPPEQIEMYVYGSAGDFGTLREALGPLWLGGHTDPSTGLVLVWLPEGVEARPAARELVAHEIAHIMLFQAAKEAGYDNLPVWLREGFASNRELNPNPDYVILLEDASEKNTLFPMAALCQPFPEEASQAVLAYAQSTAFVDYLQRQYGDAGMRAMVSSYARGAGCERGTLVAPLNRTLSQLDVQWQRSELSGNPLVGALLQSWPWLLLIAVVLTGPFLMAAAALLKPTSSKKKQGGAQ